MHAVEKGSSLHDVKAHKRSLGQMNEDPGSGIQNGRRRKRLFCNGNDISTNPFVCPNYGRGARDMNVGSMSIYGVVGVIKTRASIGFRVSALVFMIY